MKTRDFIYLSKTTKIMKTGGTMNFLKRAGVILMVVAIFASSCNKYADDFKQLNTKLDALAATVAGVTQLSADNAALKAQITALQTAVAALPTTANITALSTGLAGVGTKIDAITTALANLATAGTASKAVIDGLKTDLAALATKVAADNAAMKLQLDALGTSNTDQTTKLNALIASNDLLKVQLDAAVVTLGQVKDAQSAAATQLAVDALKLQLQAAQASLDKLLANSNMFTGAIHIYSDTEVAFYLPVIGAWNGGGMVNGGVDINTTAITNYTDLKKITDNILAVLGSSTLKIVTKAGDALTFAKLGTVIGSVDITTKAAANEISFPLLSSVTTNYSVVGFDIADDALAAVGGNVLFTWDGPYASTALTTVGGTMTLTMVPKSIVAPIKTGTTLINFPSVAVTGLINDGVNAAGIVVYPEATAINVGGGVTSVTAVKATNVTLGATSFAGLTVVADVATVVDLSKATKSTGSIDVWTKVATAVNLSKLATSTGYINVNMADATPTYYNGSVDLSALTNTTGSPTTDVTITGPQTVNLPLLVTGTVTAPQATTVTLGAHAGVIAPVLAKVATLTMGGLNVAGFDLSNYAATLVTASVTAKASSTVASVTTGAGGAKLASLTLVGPMVSANVASESKLTSLTTSGVINSMTVNNNAILAAVSFAHTHLVGGTGSVLTVTNNPKLTALKSSTDYPAFITVTGNVLLTSLDLSSYQTKLLAAPGALTTITINGNKLSGNYTNAVAITPTTPYVQTTITSADLTLLKAFIATYPTVAPPALALKIDLDKVTKDGVATTVKTLTEWMNLDAANNLYTLPKALPNGIESKAEMALVL
jgi:hypothetical protein